MALTLLRAWVRAVGQMQVQSDALVHFTEPRPVDQTDTFARLFVLSLVQHLETRREPSSAESPYDALSFGLNVPTPAALDLLSASSLSADLHPLDVLQWLLPLPKNRFASRSIPTARVLRGRAHRAAACFALSLASLTRPTLSPAAAAVPPRYHSLVQTALERLNTALLHTPVRMLNPANVFGSTAASCGNVRQAPSRADASVFLVESAVSLAAAGVGEGQISNHYNIVRRAHAVNASEGFGPEEYGNVAGGGGFHVTPHGATDDVPAPCMLETLHTFFCAAPEVYVAERVAPRRRGAVNLGESEDSDAEAEDASSLGLDDVLEPADVLGPWLGGGGRDGDDSDDGGWSEDLDAPLGEEWDPVLDVSDDNDVGLLGSGSESDRSDGFAADVAVLEGKGKMRAWTAHWVARFESEVVAEGAQFRGGGEGVAGARVNIQGSAGLDEAFERARAPVRRDFRSVLGQQGGGVGGLRQLSSAIDTAESNVARYSRRRRGGGWGGRCARDDRWGL